MTTTSTWLRSTLLPVYYYGSWPGRRLAATLARWRQQSPIMVVFYHRVADHTPTPWTISNRAFVRQINWLEKHFEIVSLGEAQRRIASGRNTHPAVCITFDDGYAENCEKALPLLVARGIPCTYFVATDYVLNDMPFPHDVAAGRPLPVNTVEQLRVLAAAGVALGAHTRTHADLGPISDADVLLQEIIGSRSDLQRATGATVRYFAFPYGLPANLNDVAVQLARKAGFAGVCSAYGGYNFPGNDPFHLQRIHGDPDFLRFRNWLTFDPRMASGARRRAQAGNGLGQHATPPPPYPGPLHSTSVA